MFVGGGGATSIYTYTCATHATRRKEPTKKLLIYFGPKREREIERTHREKESVNTYAVSRNG